MKKSLVLTTLLAILCAVSPSAASILITGGGTFSASTPGTTFSGPSQPWAFSYIVDSNSPVVSNVSAGQGFDPAYSNFSYSLNGAPVAVTPVEIRFFNAATTGMFAICFVGSCGPTSSGLQFAGPQMYSGAESAPTILTGAFASTAFVVYVGTALSFQPIVTLQAATIPEATIPEPVTKSLMAAAFLWVGLLRLYRKHY